MKAAATSNRERSYRTYGKPAYRRVFVNRDFPMLEIPQKTFDAPPPILVPATTAENVQQGQLSAFVPGLPPPPTSSPAAGRTDKVAVASTVCGLTAFVPVFSQIVGLFLGVWALIRIRRARRAGYVVRGRGWATVGITGNAFVLLGWIALFGIFATLRSTLSESATKLGPLVAKPPVHRLHVRK